MRCHPRDVTKYRITSALAAAALATGLAACGSSSSSSSSSGGSSGGGGSATLNGAGSTFAAPIYQEVGSRLKGQGVTVNYQPVGSGAGVSQFTSGTSDFAGSDPALKPAEAQAASKQGGPPVQIPFAFGAITVSYNLPGVQKGLKLDGQTVANLYLGKITSWNDPAIAKQNPGVKLPSTKVTIVHRSDSSGTTKGFAQFLADYSPAWKSGPGVDKTVKWPTGTGAKGNDGVAAAVKQTTGAVGYVEQAYALQNNFTYADVKNKAGKYVTPTLAAVTAAGEGITIPNDLGIGIIDGANPAEYPISSQTFVIFHSDLCKGGLSKADAAGVKTFVDYLLGDGQNVLKQLSYAPIPAALVAKDKAAAAKLTCNGAAL
jgi:phosphate transport system substrate-binding protein